MENEAKVESNGTAAPTVPPKGLMRKLAEVMACVDRVAKNGTNDTQHYKYAMAADIYDAVRSELAKRFVLMVPRMEKCDFTEMPTKAGGVWKLCTVYVRFEFTDAETGEVLPIVSIGQGTDSGDKAAYKAMTGATKQCLIQTFLIPTGDDPENERPERGGPPAPAGSQALKNKVGKSGHDRSFAFAFGLNKDKPISTLTVDDLRWYESAVQRDLKDPTKAKYHARAEQQLALVQAEIKLRTEAQDLDNETRGAAHPNAAPAKTTADPVVTEAKRIIERCEALKLSYDGQKLLEDKAYREALAAEVEKVAKRAAGAISEGSVEGAAKTAPVPEGPAMVYGPFKGKAISSLDGPQIFEQISFGETKIGTLDAAKAAKVRACIDALKAEQAKREAALLADAPEPGSDLDVD